MPTNKYIIQMMIRFTEESKLELEKIAKKMEVSQSAVVRMALKEYIKNHTK